MIFHKPSKKETLPLALTKMKINDHRIKKNESSKFLGVLPERKLTWKIHIKYI